MELSGLIFVALALVWAVVLLPKALRHHDELAQTRSVERVSDSMRVLARREAVSVREARLIVPAPVAPVMAAPAPVLAPASTPVAGSVPAPVTAARVRSRISAQRKAAVSAARRRRLILAILVLAGVGVGVAAGLGRLPLWSIAVPVALTVAFLVSARLLVRRERARWDAELATLKARVAEAPAVQPVVEVVEAEEDADVAEAAPADDDQGLAVVSGLDDTSCFKVGLLDDVAPTTDAGSLWDPLPVTLPTYVTKPRADRSVRTIDLNAPGVSSSGHDAASSALVADAATSPPDDLPQRAVGS